MNNVYSSPENYGLKIFAEVAQEDMCYEFNMFVVWVDKDGALCYAADSGCSCPAPFEDYVEIESLTPITGRAGLLAFYDALTAWRRSSGNTNTDYVRRKVREHME